MKRLVMFVLCAAFLCFAASAAFAQDQQLPDESTLPAFNPPTTVPVDIDSVAAGTVITAKGASAAGTGIPLWSYQIVSPVNGQTYTGVMVGKSPFARGTRTTSIPTVIIPVRSITVQGFIMDPTVADAGCLTGINTATSLTQQSPIFQNANFTIGGIPMGNTQYVDAVQRASFWQYVGAANVYHTLLGPVSVAPVQTFQAANGAQGTAYGVTTCGSIVAPAATNRRNVLNVINVNNFDVFAEQTIAALNIPATSFPLFVLYNTVMSGGTAANLNTCCILGYHSDNNDTSPNLITTYGIAEFDRGGIFTNVKDTSVMAHEVSEWMDDPLGNNPTPSWGHVGQVSGCQGNLETGDPLSGKLNPNVTMSNGFTYHLQELAFYSWFFRQSPSLGVNNLYSSNGTFTTGAGPVCVP